MDYCAGDIHTADADRLIRALQEAFGGGEFDFIPGRHTATVWCGMGGETALGTVTPPHDITGRVIGPYRMGPSGRGEIAADDGEELRAAAGPSREP